MYSIVTFRACFTITCTYSTCILSKNSTYIYKYSITHHKIHHLKKLLKSLSALHDNGFKIICVLNDSRYGM